MSDETLLIDESPPDDEASAAAVPPAPDASAETGQEAASEETANNDDDAATLRAERDDYLDTLRRVQAEFDNFRKRIRRDQEGEFGRAVAAVLERLVPVLDAFDAAREHHPEALGPLDGAVQSALAALGVERIDPAGEAFDPTCHDAVGGGDAGGGVQVEEVLRPGYRYRGRLLRPAMVRVAAASEDGESEE